MKHKLALLLFVLTTTLSPLFAQNKKQITNEEIWSLNTFASKSITGLRPMKDGKHYSSFYSNPQTKSKYILQYEYSTGNVTDTILRESDVKIKIEDYKFSDDEQKILISNNSEQIYRHSSKEDNYIYDRNAKSLKKISDNGKQLYATFSPDGSKVAFVRNNNIYWVSTGSETIENTITTDGIWNKIINGNCDWVYEEEFSFDRAFFWSSNGKNIAYYRFDESNVKEFAMSMYGELYPEEYKYKYPKAGEENSKVSIHVYNVDSKTDKAMDIGTELDQYIPRIKWTNNPNTLCILRLNRLQNKLDYILANASTGKSKTILTEESKTYLKVNNDLTFLNDNKSFIIKSDMDGWNHLYLYDLSGNQIKQITKGPWDISKYYGIDPSHKTIFYQSSEPGSARRAVYSISIDGKNKKILNTKTGTNDAVFSTDFSYFINTLSNANTPAYITLNDKSGKEIRVLEDNKKLLTKLSEYELSKKEFFTLTTSEGIELSSWMVKPINFDATKKYPVLMLVYGGPGSQKVLDSWGSTDFMWHQLLAEKGYIVVCVDNRGTGGKGADFEKMIYMDLGKYETIDQIESAKWLAKQPYIDGSRIGIFGWSYGGYMSSLCITKGADIFKSAIAVAPVTNWKYYDSIYTERYLRTPKENKKGYEDNSPINFVNQLKGNYLIIHGTGDDNVHFQNSVDMVEALIKANKKYDSEYYPNKSHSITGGKTRLHLYTKMTDFIIEKL